MSIDFAFIRELEGFETNGYIPREADGTIMGKSGVTVGSGIDIGQWTEEEFKALGVPRHIIAQLKPYFNKTNEEAAEALKANPLTLSREDAEALTTRVKQHFAREVEQWYNRNNTSDNTWDDLTPEQQTVVTSVSFQYGIGDRGAPNFKRQVLENDWEAVINNLRAFVPSGDYQTRRNKEIQYLVGANTDGRVGPQTEEAIQNFLQQPQQPTQRDANLPTQALQPAAPSYDPMGFLDNLMLLMEQRLNSPSRPSQEVSEPSTSAPIDADQEVRVPQFNEAEEQMINRLVEAKTKQQERPAFNEAEEEMIGKLVDGLKNREKRAGPVFAEERSEADEQAGLIQQIF